MDDSGQSNSDGSQKGNKAVRMMVNSLPALEMVHDMLFEGCFRKQESAVHWSELKKAFSRCFSFWNHSDQSEAFPSLWMDYRELIVVRSEEPVSHRIASQQ